MVTFFWRCILPRMARAACFSAPMSPATGIRFFALLGSLTLGSSASLESNLPTDAVDVLVMAKAALSLSLTAARSENAWAFSADFRASARLRSCCFLFFCTRSFLAVARFSNWSSKGSAWSGSSMTAGSSLLLEPYPYRGLYSCESSSKTIRPRFRLWMPLSSAYFSHFVCGLASGIRFSRGRRYRGGGSSSMYSPSSTVCGCSHIALTTSCVFSRASSRRYSSRFFFKPFDSSGR
mmetsp:Transcript_27442/g.72079  ORF Transcript_27442/g.72079 Transcript_27442/m.72079 type:complete len:236 (+) Transcript_27442:194-901(+)